MSEAAPLQPNRFFAKVLADQLYERGLELERHGYWERALHSYRRACTMDPRHVLYLLARGRICQRHGLEREAEECYEVALRLRPNDAVALYNQAQLFASRGRLDDAKRNLMQVVAGGVDLLGERAALVYCRLGDIAARTGDYAGAAIHFRKALGVAPDHRYALASLAALPRFAEFASPLAEDGRIPPKIAVYAYAGALALGMPDDDGIDIPISPGLGFESLGEVSLTLSRLVSLARYFVWPVEVVAALDAESQPIAVALAVALDARTAYTSDETPHGATAIGVTATGADLAGLSRSVTTLRERCPHSLYYAAGLRHAIWDYVPAPQIVSMPVRLEYPWNRGEASTPEHAEAIGHELGDLLRPAGPDGTLPAQLEWCAAHPRLSVELDTMRPADAPVPLLTS